MAFDMPKIYGEQAEAMKKLGFFTTLICCQGNMAKCKDKLELLDNSMREAVKRVLGNRKVVALSWDDLRYVQVAMLKIMLAECEAQETAAPK